MTAEQVKALVTDVNNGTITAERARRTLASTRWRLQFNHQTKKYYVRALQGIPYYRGR